MAIQEQERRGTKAENDAFTGAAGEITYMTDEKRPAIHDGIEAGGMYIATAQDVMTNALTSGTASGTDTYVLTLPWSGPAYVTGMKLDVTFTNANTGAATLNVNGVGAEDLKDGDGAALSAGAIEAGGTYTFEYNGTEFRQSASGGGGGGYVGSQIFTTSGTYTPTAGISRIRVTILGGGGAGNYDNDGGDGGTSSFGSHCSATGGLKGSSSGVGRNSLGGIGSGGDINLRGNSGEPAVNSRCNLGASSQLGSNGHVILANSTSAPTGYGSGGAGGRQSPAYNGGGAAGGFCIKNIEADSLGVTETITIGAGGARSSSAAGTQSGRPGIIIVEEFA